MRSGPDVSRGRKALWLPEGCDSKVDLTWPRAVRQRKLRSAARTEVARSRRCCSVLRRRFSRPLEGGLRDRSPSGHRRSSCSPADGAVAISDVLQLLLRDLILAAPAVAPAAKHRRNYASSDSTSFYANCLANDLFNECREGVSPPRRCTFECTPAISDPAAR